jgi:hypothetical protein
LMAASSVCPIRQQLTALVRLMITVTNKKSRSLPPALFKNSTRC